MKEKVILSADYTEIILAMAFQEGLLYADRLQTDAVYEKYKNVSIDYNLGKSLLEQLVLSPFPIIRRKFLDGVEGKLLEDNQIFFEDKKIRTLVPMDRYPTELFLGILKGNGIEMSKEEFKNIIDDIVKGSKEYDELEIKFGGSLPELGGFKQIMREMIRKSGLEIEEEVEDERHEELRNLNKRASNNLGKVSSVVEFLELQTIADEQNAVIKAKATFDNIPQKIKRFDDLGDKQTLILKLVEKEFGYISLRTTSLKDTLLLAQTPEFIAYRIKLNEWMNHLVSGQNDELEKIRKEIKIARRFIDMQPIVETGGIFLAFVGVPLAFFPPAAAIGVGLSIAGLIPCMTDFSLEKKYKWAMINKVNR